MKDEDDDLQTSKKTDMDFKSKGSASIVDQKFIEVNENGDPTFDMYNIPNVNLKKIKSTLPKYDPHDLTTANIDLKFDSKLPSYKDFEMLVKMAQSLQNRLNAANSKLIEKDKDIELIKKQSKHASSDLFNDRLHFAFLFASPLVRILNGELQNIMQLN